eukprot:42117-Eustigmatos_ZCMA.PRE.1
MTPWPATIILRTDTALHDALVVKLDGALLVPQVQTKDLDSVEGRFYTWIYRKPMGGVEAEM